MHWLHDYGQRRCLYVEFKATVIEQWEGLCQFWTIFDQVWYNLVNCQNTDDVSYPIASKGGRFFFCALPMQQILVNLFQSP